MSCVIVSGATHQQYLQPLRTRLELEWGKIDPFEGTHPEVVVPAPLILLDETGLLAGGLAFSTFENPLKQEISVWVNALLVEPAHRGAGYASKLVQVAEAEAIKLDIEKLFVQSGFPDLYQKLGWSLIETSGSDAVLGKCWELDSTQNK